MKIVISGYGKMGKEIFSLLKEKGEVTLFTTDDICSFDRAQQLSLYASISPRPKLSGVTIASLLTVSGQL